MILKRLQFLMIGAVVSVLHGQEPVSKTKTPLTYEVNVGGMGALGKTGADYSNSFLIGGGASLPISRWVNLDFANLDFGFGTVGGSRTGTVSDGSTRSTKNYQMMFTSGGRVNIPLGHGAALGLGGGYGAVSQTEYVPGRTYYQGGKQVIETVSCADCYNQNLQGPYLQARLFGRSSKHNAFGVNAKYFLARDSNRSYSRLPPQRWLTVSFTFSFGI